MIRPFDTLFPFRHFDRRGVYDLPVLDLNFLKETLDPRITFTRSGTATRINSNGVLETVSANTPRFDYDPVNVGLPRGLLIEESRANLLLYSTDLSTGWSKGTTATWALNAATAPDGTMTALGVDGLNGTTLLSTAGALYRLNTTVTGNTTYTFSVYVRAKTGTASNVVLRINETGGNNNVSSPVSITDQWQRLLLTVTTAAGATAAGCLLGTSATGVLANVYAWGAQLELGAFATSYIPTSTAAVTRNADVAVMTGTNFSDWYNATEGTIYSDFSSFETVAGRNATAISIDDATTNNRLQIRRNVTGSVSSAIVVEGGTIQASFTGGAFAVGGIARAALAYKANDFAMASEGVLRSTDGSGTVPAVTQAQIGTGAGTNIVNGHIRRIAFYPRRLSNQELMELTA